MRIRTRGLWVLGFLMLIALPVFAADEPPTAIYVKLYQESDEGYDLVKIEPATDTVSDIFSMESEQAAVLSTLEAFSSLEWQAFQAELAANVPADQQARVSNEMSAANLTATIQGFYETANGDLVIERHVSQCFSLDSTGDGPPVSRCYGGFEFSLLDVATQQERVIWALPYHAGGQLEGDGCYMANLYENYSGHQPIDQVLIHPTDSLLVVRLWSFGGCAHPAFVIDYSDEAVEVKEFSNILSVAWSPDASEMAYVQGCTYGTLNLATFEETLLETETVSDCMPDLWSLWIAWPSSETLIFTKGTASDEGYQQSIVWHNRETGAETALDLPFGQALFYALSVTEGDSTTVFGIGDTGLGFMSHPNVMMDATPGEFLAEDIPTPSDAHSANRTYLFVEGGVIDASLNFYPIAFDEFRDRLSASQIEPEIIGVELPCLDGESC